MNPTAYWELSPAVLVVMVVGGYPLGVVAVGLGRVSLAPCWSACAGWLLAWTRVTIARVRAACSFWGPPGVGSPCGRVGRGAGSGMQVWGSGCALPAEGPACWVGACGLAVVAGLAESLAAVGVVRVEAEFDEVSSFDGVVVGDGCDGEAFALTVAVGLVAHADRVSGEYLFAEPLVSGGVVGVAGWAACAFAVSLVGGASACAGGHQRGAARDWADGVAGHRVPYGLETANAPGRWASGRCVGMTGVLPVDDT